MQPLADPSFDGSGAMGAASAGDGSVRATVDASGSLADAYTYCSSGNILGSSGTAQNELNFQGGYLANNEGLYLGNGLFVLIAVGLLIHARRIW